MNENVLEQLRAQVRAPLAADKVTEDKRLKAEILLMRNHANVAEDKPGHFVCEGGYGRGVADQKEATLFELVTQDPTRASEFKAVAARLHRAIDRESPYSGDMHFLLRGQRSDAHPWIQELLEA